mgnify:CR=1 FL=1
MTEFRCFRNEDPPRLAEVWRASDLGPSALQPMTASLLETAVFSKPYFDREGLVVAVEQDQVVGFAHAAFAPSGDQSAIDTRTGTTVLVVMTPQCDHERVGAGLLERCEAYLREIGRAHV